jgi:TBC1 domain family protein 5
VLKADYTTALTLLLRYPSPQPYEPQTFVHDALYLEQNPTADRGSFIISKYSGRPPDPKGRTQSSTRPTRKAFLWDDFKSRSQSSSPSLQYARNSPKSLETLFQDVSQGIQRRTESWGVAKAVRGAVTEARKNMQTMHYEHNLRAGSRPGSSGITPGFQSKASTTNAATAGLETKINVLEERNKILASTLRDALDDLGLQLADVKDLDPGTKSAMKQALAKAESVQVCLNDSSLPVDSSQALSCVDAEKEQPNDPQEKANPTNNNEEAEDSASKQLPTLNPANTDTTVPTADGGTSKPTRIATVNRTNTKQTTGGARAIPSRPAVRPSLTDSGFSWMLGGGRNLSGFVSSTSPPPEQTRHLDQARKANALFGSGGDENPGTDADHGELALYSLRGSREPLSGAGPL